MNINILPSSVKTIIILGIPGPSILIAVIVTLYGIKETTE
jgi:hypothetical protein